MALSAPYGCKVGFSGNLTWSGVLSRSASGIADEEGNYAYSTKKGGERSVRRKIHPPTYHMA
eukprot:6804407-Prymnesium_polylepis.1